MEVNVVDLWVWLVKQGPLIVFAGIVIYWLVRRNEKLEVKYEKSLEDNAELSRNVIKLAVAYENKFDDNKEDNKEIKTLLEKIINKIEYIRR